jgi:hypothetical protein
MTSSVIHCFPFRFSFKQHPFYREYKTRVHSEKETAPQGRGEEYSINAIYLFRIEDVLVLHVSLYRKYSSAELSEFVQVGGVVYSVASDVLRLYLPINENTRPYRHLSLLLYCWQIRDKLMKNEIIKQQHDNN